MLGGAGAAEDQMGVAIDQPRGDPGAAQGDDLLGAEAGELGALADAQDAAVLDGDGGIRDHAQRIAGSPLHGSDMAVDEEAIPHDGWQWSRAMLVVKR